MKFKATKDFGVDYHKFKAGTTYDAERFGLSKDELERYRDEGLCELEDMPADEDVATRRPSRKKKRAQSESPPDADD